MDKKAKDILFKTYWTSAGWTKQADRKTDPADFEYAKSKGVMFNNVTITKSELLEQLERTVKSISLKTVTDAFLCSMTNKRLDWRSGLGSFVNAHRILRASAVYDYHIGYGHDLDINVLNFERIKWGGVRHFQALYNLVDLELLKKEMIPSPSEEDKERLKTLLYAVENSLPGETASKIRDRLRSVLPFSKQEIHTLLEILGCAEILLPQRFDRKVPGKHDWNFMLFWRGEDKYSKANYAYYFGFYGIG